MPDSYGMPLWTSPRFRCDRSHARLNVRNVNPIAAMANPTTYQIPVKRSSLPILASGAPTFAAPDVLSVRPAWDARNAWSRWLLCSRAAAEAVAAHLEFYRE